MEDRSKYFYCYSKRMQKFLSIFGFKYVDKGVNKNTNIEYYTYLKSEELDRAIQEWNNIKEKFDKK